MKRNAKIMSEILCEPNIVNSLTVVIEYDQVKDSNQSKVNNKPYTFLAGVGLI